MSDSRGARHSPLAKALLSTNTQRSIRAHLDETRRRRTDEEDPLLGGIEGFHEDRSRAEQHSGSGMAAAAAAARRRAAPDRGKDVREEEEKRRREEEVVAEAVEETRRREEEKGNKGENANGRRSADDGDRDRAAKGRSMASTLNAGTTGSRSRSSRTGGSGGSGSSASSASSSRKRSVGRGRGFTRGARHVSMEGLGMLFPEGRTGLRFPLHDGEEAHGGGALMNGGGGSLMATTSAEDLLAASDWSDAGEPANVTVRSPGSSPVLMAAAGGPRLYDDASATIFSDADVAVLDSTIDGTLDGAGGRGLRLAGGAFPSLSLASHVADGSARSAPLPRWSVSQSEAVEEEEPIVAPEPAMKMDRSDAVAIYGFVGWIFTFIAYVLYLIWALLPEHVIEGSLGVMWYPNRYWSIAGPAWILVLILYVFSSAFFFNMMVTKPLSSVSYLRDKHSVEEEAELDSFKLSDDAYAVPQLTDINISDVNKVLFQ